ncbi:MAG: hypothetical protein ACLTJQ_06745 [Dialister invisus]|mgnify:FL=1|uniref:hypothetical protein n=1 Tax=Dialister invisus TaxID=218538 RepID=UPI0039938A3A
MHKGYTGEWDNNWDYLSPEEQKIRSRIYDTIHNESELFQYYSLQEKIWVIVRGFLAFYGVASIVVQILN